MSTHFYEWLAHAEGLELNTEISIPDGIASAEAAITEVLNITPSILPALLLGNHSFRPPSSAINLSLPLDRSSVEGLGSDKGSITLDAQATILRKGLYRLALIACRRKYWLTAPHNDNAASSTINEDLAYSAHWVVQHTLGSGRFGVVRAFRHKVTGQYIAEKRTILAPEHSAYRKDVKVLQNAKNTHVVEYLGEFYNEKQAQFCIYMEYVPGGTLAGLATSIQLDDRDVRILSRQVVKALIFLHNLQIVHRNIKGANLFLTLEGCVKVGDLGGPFELESASFSLAGTPQWLSPEAVRSSDDSRIDVWSLGMVIVEMRSQGHPWRNLPSWQTLCRLDSWDYDDPLFIQYTEELLATVGPECRITLQKIFSREENRPYSSQLPDLAWFSETEM